MQTGSFRDQIERSRRLLNVLCANDGTANAVGLQSEDVVILAAQCIWHIRDWIINDTTIYELNTQAFDKAVHEDPYLKACADIANQSKHMRLRRTKSGAKISVVSRIFRTLQHSPDPAIPLNPS